MAKILIVGAASGIGAGLAASLLQNTQHSLITIDDLRVESSLNNLQFALSHKKGDRHKFYLTQVNDLHIAERLFELERPECVVFCKTPEPQVYHQSLAKILHCASKFNSKVIYINQDSWSYERSESHKYGVELCRSESNKEVSCILHTCRVYGPRLDPPDPVMRAVSGILDGKWPNTVGASSRPREWIYVKDLISAVEAIIHSNDVSGEYYASSSQVASEHEIIMCLQMISEGRPFSFTKHNDVILHDCSRIHSLGWRPKYQLRDALEHTLSWYSINKWARGA